MDLLLFPHTPASSSDKPLPTSCPRALLGLAVFQNLHKAEYIRSVHVYDENGSPLSIQQEFLLNSGAFSQIGTPILLACFGLHGLKHYLDMVRKRLEKEWWKCILQFCVSSPDDTAAAAPLLSTFRIRELQVIPSLAEDLHLVEDYLLKSCNSSDAASSFSACHHSTDGNLALFEYLKEPELPDTMQQTRASQSPRTSIPQKLQLDLWQKWGCDLELASPRLSDFFDLPSLRTNTSETSVPVDGATSSQASSSFSSQNAESSSWGTLNIRENTPALVDTAGEPPFFDVFVSKAARNAPEGLNVDASQPVQLDYFIAESSITNKVQLQHVIPRSVNGNLARMPSQEHHQTPAISNLSEEESPIGSSESDWGETKGRKRGEYTRKGSHTRAASERLTELTYDDIFPYFSMPISEAAKALKVGLTVLKKRCRVFDITRWPHRKIKSIDSMIGNIQDFANEDGAKDLDRVQSTVKDLQEQRKEMEERPGMELADRTKRLRQALFKASYNKKKRHHVTHASSNVPSGTVDDAAAAAAANHPAMAMATCAAAYEPNWQENLLISSTSTYYYNNNNHINNNNKNTCITSGMACSSSLAWST